METADTVSQRSEQNREEPLRNPKLKRCQLDRKNGQVLAKDVVVKPTIEMLVEGSTTIVSDTTKGTTLTRKLDRGKGSLISED